MRVDLGNLTEITKKSAAVQNKGTQAVLNENITTKETDKTGHSYTVKSVTYETLLAEDKKSAEDIAMQADAVDPQAMHDEMAVLANTTTEEDYEKMEEDGYSVNDTEIPEIVTEMDKIKIQLAKAGVDIRIFGDDVSVEKISYSKFKVSINRFTHSEAFCTSFLKTSCSFCAYAFFASAQ